jgi:opacity protein-like surface antigen
VDVYLGATLGVEGSVVVREGNVRATGEADVAADFTVGGRFGHWFKRLPWLGIALDGSFFQPEVESLLTIDTVHDLDLTIGSLSGLLMVRPFATTPLQPYVGVGPGVFFTHLDVESFSETDTAVGLDVRAGLKWHCLPPFSLFAEYRYTRVEAEFRDTFRNIPTTVEATLEHHHVLVGMAFRF